MDSSSLALRASGDGDLLPEKGDGQKKTSGRRISFSNSPTPAASEKSRRASVVDAGIGESTVVGSGKTIKGEPGRRQSVQHSKSVPALDVATRSASSPFRSSTHGDLGNDSEENEDEKNSSESAAVVAPANTRDGESLPGQGRRLSLNIFPSARANNKTSAVENKKSMPSFMQSTNSSARRGSVMGASGGNGAKQVKLGRRMSTSLMGSESAPDLKALRATVAAGPGAQMAGKEAMARAGGEMRRRMSMSDAGSPFADMDTKRNTGESVPGPSAWTTKVRPSSMNRQL